MGRTVIYDPFRRMPPLLRDFLGVAHGLLIGAIGIVALTEHGATWATVPLLIGTILYAAARAWWDGRRLAKRLVRLS